MDGVLCATGSKQNILLHVGVAHDSNEHNYYFKST